LYVNINLIFLKIYIYFKENYSYKRNYMFLGSIFLLNVLQKNNYTRSLMLRVSFCKQNVKINKD